MENDLEKACNLKLLLCAFEQLSGLKINFHKTEIFYFSEAKESIARYTELFGCSQGEFHFRKLSNADWKEVEEHFEKCLNSCKGKHLSTSGGLTLINSVLSSLPMYMILFLQSHEVCLENWIIFCQDFFLVK